MLEFLKKRVYPIGVDLGSDNLKMAQLGFDGKRLYLHAAWYETKPDEIETGSGDWQRWAAKAAKRIASQGDFKGRNVVTAMPSDDLFIDQIRIPHTAEPRVDTTVFSRVQRKLPFEAEGAMVKNVVVGRNNGDGEMDILVMAASRKIIDRHLAIYEKSGLEVHGIGVWPLAMTNSYVTFFGRRSTDRDTVTMLMDIGSNHTNIVICRHQNLLFARVIMIGFKQLEQGEMVQRLMAEIDACCRYFESVSNGTRLQRLIFLSGRNVDKVICDQVAELAQKMQVPAQIGDVLAAVDVRPGRERDIERRGCQIDWATAFGLGLYGVDVERDESR